LPFLGFAALDPEWATNKSVDALTLFNGQLNRRDADTREFPKKGRRYFSRLVLALYFLGSKLRVGLQFHDNRVEIYES
jgi:hypothetical protein